jgi:hypothetical protein
MPLLPVLLVPVLLGWPGLVVGMTCAVLIWIKNRN